MSRNYKEPVKLLNQTVTGTTPIQSIPLDLRNMGKATFHINVLAGLTATFLLMISGDGVNYVDSGAVIPSTSGSAQNIVWSDTVSAPYALIQITPSSGSASVVITGSAKGF